MIQKYSEADWKSRSRIHLKLSKETHEKVRRLAEKRGITQSQLIRDCLMKELNENKSEL